MIDRGEGRLPIGAEWFDLWHTHSDWNGAGNRDPESRRVCLRALFSLWADAELLAEPLSCSWQSWLVIDPEDSGQDAVYLHTPNPNRDNFPYAFDGVAWGVEPPPWLEDFMNRPGVVWGRSEYDGPVLYWVHRSPAITEQVAEPSCQGPRR